MKLPSSGLITFVCLASLCMEAKEPIRTFTDAEGREIKARIHNTDGQTVLLETEDGQGFKTTIEVFSKTQITSEIGNRVLHRKLKVLN